MRSFDKFVISNTEPRSKEVLWISHNDDKVIASAFVDGEWRSVGADPDLSDYLTKEAYQEYMTSYYTKTQVDALNTAKADKADLPNDVSRTATDVCFAHAEGGNIDYLFWLRQADSTKAGAMTAADKVKLDALPTNASLTTLLNNKQNKYLVESTTVPLIGCGLFPNSSNVLQPSEGNYQLITPIVLHKGDKVTIVSPHIGAQIYFSTSAFVEGLEVTRKVNYTTPGTYTYTADEEGYYGFATVGTITSIIKEGVTVEDKLDTLTPYEEILYADLVTKRNSGTLNPGTLYRITDYITTTTQTNTQSANHPFDIIVLATGTNTLSEDALAIQHEGDTYFAHSNLSAWELKYSLDNDMHKYEWADTTNGKGVIYYLKDEWNNECPYDFKNIQFKWSGAKTISNIIADTWYYTFSLNNTAVITEFSTDASTKCLGNKINRYFLYPGIQSLNFIVFNSGLTSENCTNNVFGNNCHDNTFGANCNSNTFGKKCTYNAFGSGYSNNIFGNNCSDNTFGNNCSDNTFGNNCSDNTFGNISSSNTFGNNCLKNTSGISFFGNTFGNGCQFNIFANNCLDNIFGNNCSNNTFNNNCLNNTFVNSSRNNELKDLSQGNYFDDVHEIVIAGSYLRIGRVTSEKLEINLISEAISGNSIIIPLLLSEGEEQNFSVVEAYDSDWPSPTFHNLGTTSITQSIGGMLQVYFNTTPQGPIYIKLVYSGGGCCGGCCGSC